MLELKHDVHEHPSTIYCFSETGLSSSSSDREFAFNDNFVFRADRTSNVHGGAMILMPKFAKWVLLGAISNPSLEAVAVKILSNPVFTFINVNRSPNPDNTFFERIDFFFFSLVMKNERFLLAGDFNFPGIDLQKSSINGSDQASIKFCDFFLIIGY